MNWNVVTEAPVAIQLHLLTVIPAFFLGTWLIFFSVKGSRLHRQLGAAYLLLMLVTAITAIFIQSIHPGHWSPIHVFVPVTFFGVAAALWGVRRGNIRLHRGAMLGLYVGGLLIAGSFTFMPGRIMHRLFLG